MTMVQQSPRYMYTNEKEDGQFNIKQKVATFKQY